MPEQSSTDEPISVEAADRSRRRVRRHTERARRRKAQRVVYAVAAAAAIAAVAAKGEPTGLLVADVVYRAGFAALVTIAAARAKRWTWFVLAGAAGAVGSEDPLALSLAAGSLATGFFSLWFGRRQRELGAAAGALAAQALLWLPTDLPFAVPTATALLAVVPLFVSALRNTADLRRWRWPVAGSVVTLGAIGVAFVFAMLQAEGHARTGIAAAREGLEAAGDGQDPQSAARFAEASEELDLARAAVGAWWLAPARAVPVLAQHVEAVDRIAVEGKALAALSAEQAATLDVSGLSRDEGGFDLAAIAALAPQADVVVAALERADAVIDEVSSPWIVAPAADRIDDFATEIDDVLPTARNAADALRLAPDLLGVEGPRRYLVLVGNPAEARELGGFVASVGFITADAGDLDFTSAGSVTSANRAVAASGLAIEGDLPTPLPASAPERFVQNWTNTVDFTGTAEVADQLGPAIVGNDVDGVLYLDPYAIGSLLELTGPVPIEGREPLAAADAVDYLLRDQYANVALDEDGERKDRLRDTADAAFDQLTSSSLPDPRRIADLLAPSVQARRLLFSTGDDAGHELLNRVGLRPAVDLGLADQIQVTHQNLRANKLDAYLERSIVYGLSIDAAGNAEGTVTVELTNTAPAEGLDPYVTGDGGDNSSGRPEVQHRIGLALYSRLESAGTTADGETSGSSTSKRGDLYRTSTRVDIPPGETVTVVFDLRGTIDPENYRLAVLPAGVANPDMFAATVDRPNGDTTVDTTPLDRVIHSDRAP